MSGNLVANAQRMPRRSFCRHRANNALSHPRRRRWTGIAPEFREEVFRPFYRLDEARNQDQSGAGLGPRHRARHCSLACGDVSWGRARWRAWRAASYCVRSPARRAQTEGVIQRTQVSLLGAAPRLLGRQLAALTHQVGISELPSLPATPGFSSILSWRSLALHFLAILPATGRSYGTGRTIPPRSRRRRFAGLENVDIEIGVGDLDVSDMGSSDRRDQRARPMIR